MKILAAFFISLLITGACSTTDKALRQQEKQLREQADSLQAAAAMQALEKQQFMVLVDRISFRHGGTYPVQSNINYVYVNGDKGSVQLASPVAAPGPNGIGGLTFTGGVRNFKFRTDKKGNATATCMVSGYGRTANISIKLRKGDTRAHIDIDAGAGNMAMSADGTLTVYDPSLIVKGYPD